MSKAVKKIILISICGLCLLNSVAAAGKATLFNMTTEDTVRLNEKQPEGQVIMDARTIRKAPPILQVPIIKITNQNKVPLAISVNLVWGPRDSLHISQKMIEIGNFSIFPADQVGVYSLRTSEVFDQLRVSPKEIEDGKIVVALKFEMASVSEEKDLKNVEVVIAPLRWKME
jgi:hypothetical protein